MFRIEWIRANSIDSWTATGRWVENFQTFWIKILRVLFLNAILNISLLECQSRCITWAIVLVFWTNATARANCFAKVVNKFSVLWKIRQSNTRISLFLLCSFSVANGQPPPVFTWTLDGFAVSKIALKHNELHNILTLQLFYLEKSIYSLSITHIHSHCWASRISIASIQENVMKNAIWTEFWNRFGFQSYRKWANVSQIDMSNFIFHRFTAMQSCQYFFNVSKFWMVSARTLTLIWFDWFFFVR